MCNCTYFDLPRLKTTKICNITEKCPEEASVVWFSEDPDIQSPYDTCQCLEPCNDIHYSIVTEKSVEIDYKNDLMVQKVLKAYQEQG